MRRWTCQFIALMEGRDRAERGCARPARMVRGWRGIDVTFSAPKSVSVVSALGDPWQREQSRSAREGCRALDGVPEERVPVVRRRYGGQVVEGRPG